MAIARKALVGAAVATIALTAQATGLVGAGAAAPTAHIAHSYAYLKTRGTYLNTTVYGGRTWSVSQTEIVERWIGKDGSGRQRTASLAPKFVSPSDRKVWEEAGRPVFLAHGFKSHIGDEFLPAGSFGERVYEAAALSEMPRDPSELAGWLRANVNDPANGGGAGNGFPDSVKTLDLVAELMQNPLATSAQRTALYEAETQVPGIEGLGEAHDEIGRQGVAVGAQSDNSGIQTLYSLIFDPETSRVLASEEKRLAPSASQADQARPLPTSSTTYLEAGTTFSRRSRPRAHGGRKQSAQRSASRRSKTAGMWVR